MLNNIEVYQSVRNMYRHLIVNYSLQIWEMCFYFMLTNKFWYSNTSLYFLKRTGQLWLFQKIIRNITYYSSIVITGICTCLRALFCWFKKQQLLLFAYNEQTHLLQKKLCCLFANWYSRAFISIVIWPLHKDIYTLQKDNWNAEIYDSLR